MRARRRLFGKSSPSFIESLNLRIAICDAKGDTILAIGYRNMLEAGKTPISDSCKVSTESTSLLPIPQTVASPSTTKEDPERGEERRSSGTTAVIEGSLPTQSYEPLQATEKLMNELELGVNEIVTRSLVRMRYRPYFINLRKFDPTASLLAAAEEGNIEVAWVLLTEFPRVRACHMQHMSEGFFPVAQTNANSTNAVYAIRARCHGDVLAKACMVEDSSRRKEVVNMLLESGIDSSVLTTKALRIKVTAPIVVACLRGHYGILADMLRKGPQISIMGDTGSHSLEAILARGNHSQGGDEAASLLLSYSKDLKLPGTAPQSNGCTVSALGTALHLKWLKTTERLLKIGANVEDLNEDLNKQYFIPGWNFTPGVYEIMGLANFGQHFPYPKLTALCRAAGMGSQRSVALLLQYGANVDGGSSVLENSNSVVGSRRITTPLILATACGNKPVVELLLGYGANVDLSGITEIGGPIKSPLLCAAGKGYSEILELLLEHGAQIGFGEGISALQSAVDGGHQDTVSTLLDNGVEVKAHSPHVSTLLIRAAEKGYLAISKLLLERGARIGAAEGAAALFIAIDSGHQDIVSALLGSGVDVNAKGPTGSALERATCLGHIEIVRILVQHGCEIQSLLIRWQRGKRFGDSWEDVYAVAFREGSDASCFKPELAKEARLEDPSRLAVLLYNSMNLSAETALPIRGLWFSKEEVNNAFSIAVISHSWQNMKLLLDTGEVNPKGTHTNGMPWTFLTAGSKVFYGGHHLREAVEILIESGAEPDLFYGGHTLISYIILYHGLQPATFRFLLRKGACINGRKEVVPLCLAASAGQLEVVSCLLALGAEVNRLQDGHSARWYAQKNKVKKTKDNVKDPFAARQDHEEVDKLLKKKGGKVI